MKKTQNLCVKGRRMFPQLLLLATLFSCSKKDIQDPTLQLDKNHLLDKTTATATSTTNHLIFEETFEDGTPFDNLVRTRFPASYSFSVVTNPAFAGTHSGRFELRDTDPMLNGGTRCELHFDPVETVNQWYSYAVYFPSVGYEYDNSEEVITQWHESPRDGVPATSPSISLQTKADRMLLVVMSTPTTKIKYDLGAIVKNKWHQFVYHINHSYKSDGLIELWIDGVKVANHTGPNMYDLSKYEFPVFNLGIYKHDWNYDKTTDTHKRIFYFDNIRRGTQYATYSEMASASTSNSGTDTTTSTPAPAPAPAPDPSTTQTSQTSAITSYTLIDAGTEKDIMTISNGATISLAKIGTSKLNIRANTSSAQGSVKFELGGVQSRAYTDSDIPYALFGNSGSNYYYGNWNPPALGTYTLKATPYSGAKGTGTAGTPYSISFTITK